MRCDDGNNIDGDGCSSKCFIEKGFYKDFSGQVRDICGDGIDHQLPIGACDDDNKLDGDGCSSTCSVE
jgi:cysteine-rich repeat protein